MNIAAAVLFVLVIYLLAKNIYSRNWDKKLSVDISFSQHEAFEGDDISLFETIVNRKLLPLPVLMLKFNIARCLRYKDVGICDTGSDELFDDGKNAAVTDFVYRNDIVSVSSYQKKVRTLPIKCVSRGYCSISTIYMISNDFFMGNKMTSTSKCFTDLYIYPKYIDSDRFDISFNSLMGDILTKRYINEDPFEFKGIRDYQSYDSLKSVNWKASARSMGLKVNQTDTTASWQVTILLNLDAISGLRDEDLDENAIRLVGTFANKLLDQGIPVSFITNARDNYTGQGVLIEHGCGKGHIKTILMALARIGIYKNEPDDFASLLPHIISKSGSHDWFLIISSTTSERITAVLKEHTDNLKYIIPLRPDTHIKLDDTISKCYVPWIVNY